MPFFFFPQDSSGIPEPSQFGKKTLCSLKILQKFLSYQQISSKLLTQLGVMRLLLLSYQTRIRRGSMHSERRKEPLLSVAGNQTMGVWHFLGLQLRRASLSSTLGYSQRPPFGSSSLYSNDIPTRNHSQSWVNHTLIMELSLQFRAQSGNESKDFLGNL